MPSTGDVCDGKQIQSKVYPARVVTQLAHVTTGKWRPQWEICAARLCVDIRLIIGAGNVLADAVS